MFGVPPRFVEEVGSSGEEESKYVENEKDDFREPQKFLHEIGNARSTDNNDPSSCFICYNPICPRVPPPPTTYAMTLPLHPSLLFSHSDKIAYDKYLQMEIIYFCTCI